MFFVLNSGRSGSSTIAKALSHAPDCICLHEPAPRLIEEAARYRYGELTNSDVVDMLKSSRPHPTEGKLYGESSSELSLIIPALEQAFPGSKYVWLVRDGRDVISSATQSGWFYKREAQPLSTAFQRSRLRGDRVGVVTPEAWATWNAFERDCWVWAYTNATIREDLDRLAPHRYISVRVDQLDASMGSLTAFLEINRVPPSTERTGSRTPAWTAAESTEQRDSTLTWEHWSDKERAIFARHCGRLMDEHYPDWRADNRWRNITREVREDAPAVSGRLQQNGQRSNDRSARERLAEDRADLADAQQPKADLSAHPELSRTRQTSTNDTSDQPEHYNNLFREMERENLECNNELRLQKQKIEHQTQQIARLRAEIAQRKDQISRHKRALIRIENNEVRLKGSIEQMAQRISELASENRSLIKRLNDVLDSTSWRVGHSVVFPLHTALLVFRRGLTHRAGTNKTHRKTASSSFPSFDGRRKQRGEAPEGTSGAGTKPDGNPDLLPAPEGASFVDRKPRPNRPHAGVSGPPNLRTDTSLAQRASEPRKTAQEIPLPWDHNPPLKEKHRSNKLERAVARHREKLLGLGLCERAYTNLVAASASNNPARQRSAAWSLALWHADRYTKHDADLALRFLVRALPRSGAKREAQQGLIILAETLELLDRTDEAITILDHSLEHNPSADLFLARARLEATPENRLGFLNRALALCDLEPLELKPSDSGNVLNRLQGIGACGPTEAPPWPSVSVIMPVFNSESTLPGALDSLLAQTWPPLEILVVDDCSTDRSLDVAEAYAARDSRIRVLRTASNSGAYVARNTALAVAKGQLVTVHDADDWSHPQKLEIHARHLLSHPNAIANASQHARTEKDLRFFRRGMPGTYIGKCLSSLMFRRQPVMDKIGFWDSVRFGSDGEFIKRLVRVFGNESVQHMETGLLTILRQDAASLTGSSAFGYPGYFYGARREYHDAFRAFHQGSTPDDLFYPFPQTKRPFRVPAPMLPDCRPQGSSPRHFDVITASDFRLPGGTTKSNIEELCTQAEMGLTCGIVPMYRFEMSPDMEMNHGVRELINKGLASVIVFGEEVSCDLLIIRFPPILQEPQRWLPRVSANHVRIIINQTPLSTYGGGGRRLFDLGTCAHNLQQWIGAPATWHPIGPLVRETLLEHHRNELANIDLSETEWVNIIDVDSWRRSSRPAPSETIRIGRHSRPQAEKWPADPETLLAVYPTDPRFEIRVLGGADVPRDTLGQLPGNWHVWEFGEIKPRDFLATLDVFVYFTHEGWVESFGRVILEAMAVGVPVVLPHVYTKLFSDAAIYAYPHEVSDRVEALMADPAYYTRVVENARRYVESRFGRSVHRERVRGLLGRNAAR